MENNIGESLTSVDKLKHLVRNRYGKSLEVLQVCDTSYLNYNDFQIKGVDLHIPLMVDDHLLGTAVINDASTLDVESKKTLAQMTKMILEPVLYNSYLERKEMNLSVADKYHNLHKDKNVVSIEFESHRDGHSYEEIELDEEPLDGSKLLSHLCNLECSNPTLVKKVALQIHEMTHRWAFAPWESIKSQITSVTDLVNLGAMTLFIEDVTQLSMEDQILIEEYLTGDRVAQDPLFVTACKSIEDLSPDTFFPNFFDEMEISSFKIDKAPMDINSLREVLELFFFEGDSNPLN